MDGRILAQKKVLWQPPPPTINEYRHRHHPTNERFREKKLKIKTLKQPTDTRFVPSRYMYVYATLQPVKQTTRHSSIASDTQTRDPQAAAAVVASQQHF